MYINEKEYRFRGQGIADFLKKSCRCHVKKLKYLLNCNSAQWGQKAALNAGSLLLTGGKRWSWHCFFYLVRGYGQVANPCPASIINCV